MKLVANLALGTTRKRVGALAQALDWYLKRVAEEGKQPRANPLRMLPKNSSIYSAHERQTIAARLRPGGPALENRGGYHAPIFDLPN